MLDNVELVSTLEETKSKAGEASIKEYFSDNCSAIEMHSQRTLAQKSDYFTHVCLIF